MTDRDRLIELLKETETNPEKTCPHYLEADCFKCPYDKGEDCDHEARKADYLLANGVIVPPCKVGETVYCLIQGFENPLKATVNRITVQVSGVVVSCSVSGYFGQSYMATDFGEKIFLTKEEAEQKLKEREKV